MTMATVVHVEWARMLSEGQGCATRKHRPTCSPGPPQSVGQHSVPRPSVARDRTPSGDLPGGRRTGLPSQSPGAHGDLILSASLVNDSRLIPHVIDEAGGRHQKFRDWLSNELRLGVMGDNRNSRRWGRTLDVRHGGHRRHAPPSLRALHAGRLSSVCHAAVVCCEQR